MDLKEREKKVIELYVNGVSCSNISKTIGIERKSVYRILERNDIQLKIKEKKTCALCPNQILSKISNCLCGTCSTNVRRYNTKKKAVEYKDNKCIRCGWSGDISGFDFHHSNPSEKDFELSGKIIASMKWDKVTVELDKCELLCALCHRLEHSNYKNEVFLREAEKFK